MRKFSVDKNTLHFLQSYGTEILLLILLRIYITRVNSTTMRNVDETKLYCDE